MAGDIHQKQWVIERSTADKFVGDKKGDSKLKILETWKKHTNLFLLALAPSGNNNFHPLKP